jgi:hypothetical protein
MSVRIALVGAIALVFAACGGNDGEPLISGTVTGVYKGQAFTPVNGYAQLVQNQTVIALGDGPIKCGSDSSTTPVSGITAEFRLPATITPQTYANVETTLSQISGTNFDATITFTGNVTLTSVTADTVAGSISYDYTDAQSQHFSTNGTFEVTRCP